MFVIRGYPILDKPKSMSWQTALQPEDSDNPSADELQVVDQVVVAELVLDYDLIT